MDSAVWSPDCFPEFGAILATPIYCLVGAEVPSVSHLLLLGWITGSAILGDSIGFTEFFISNLGIRYSGICFLAEFPPIPLLFLIHFADVSRGVEQSCVQLLGCRKASNKSQNVWESNQRVVLQR